MAGIYIHIPFCKQKCHYCNFYSVASTKYRKAFVNSLLREIHDRINYLADETVTTIYFGGGTPSLLDKNEINIIIDTLKQVFSVKADAEITLEANPDDLNITYLKMLRKQTPVNRLSIGVQSFFDDDLVYLNRVHNGKQANIAIETALKEGFHNLTADLIYGIPTLTEEKWKYNLDQFFSYNIPHLSAYSLTVEPKTALNTLIRKNKMAVTDEEQAIKHFQILLKETKAKDYIHYEISNFAKKKYYSKHNSIYWLGGHYIGFGPSAHSYNGTSRQWNISNMKDYIEADKIEKTIKEKEVLSIDQQYNEYVMTSIRTSWGCDAEHINNAFGAKYAQHFLHSVKPFVGEYKIQEDKAQYILTDHGKLFADTIAASLFI